MLTLLGVCFTIFLTGIPVFPYLPVSTIHLTLLGYFTPQWLCKTYYIVLCTAVNHLLGIRKCDNLLILTAFNFSENSLGFNWWTNIAIFVNLIQLYFEIHTVLNDIAHLLIIHTIVTAKVVSASYLSWHDYLTVYSRLTFQDLVRFCH